jgi:ribosomal RNA-processing protein 12
LSFQEVIPKIMGEVLLCLKDSNGKTREAAYQLLLAMAEVRNDMTDFFQIILAALGAQTPHMRSAAVMALSRLVFEYARTDDTVQALLPSLLETVVVLFDENSREVIKSVVAFVRVSVAALSPDQLEPLLPAVVEGLMKYNKGKDRFRAKIKIILKKLVRTYGYEKITPLVPEGDARLLTHMRKLAERAARRKAAEKEAGHEDGEDGFDDLMDSDEEDSDGGRTLMTGVTGFTRMTGRTGKSTRTAAMERSERGSVMQSLAKSAKTARTGPTAPRIRAEKNGEIMDMLDSSMAKNVHFGDDDANDEFSDDDDGGVMEFDEQGRLVINDEFDEPERTEKQSQDIDDENAELHRGGKRQRLSKFESAKVSREEATGQKPKKNTKSKGPKALGAAYKSKKAGGDVQKKGQKYEPYAYVPLDGKSYTKKNRSNAISQMSTVVRDKGGKRKR